MCREFIVHSSAVIYRQERVARTVLCAGFHLPSLVRDGDAWGGTHGSVFLFGTSVQVACFLLAECLIGFAESKLHMWLAAARGMHGSDQLALTCS